MESLSLQVGVSLAGIRRVGSMFEPWQGEIGRGEFWIPTGEDAWTSMSWISSFNQSHGL
jgi:hypothetical protein